ncbi:bud emergence protein 1 [Boothiomyces macroporosus]|uniref:Bud emergence protein 1 n=1 Tax=Boothiomyces macroporosus TaxID=261099 RepID=A0AAD5UEN6_9FUNG|nr:bud emergence protein 1 [Boothiomyces macroporosus]
MNPYYSVVPVNPRDNDYRQERSDQYYQANSQPSNPPRKSKSRRPPVEIQPRGSSNPKQIFNLPPKKIIKASKSFQATKTGELTFEKGDFFYVIQERPELEVYEVTNPILQLRGLVPMSHFQNVNRNAAEEQYQNQQNGYENEKYQDYPEDARYEDRYENDRYGERYEEPRYEDSRYDDRYADESRYEDDSRYRKDSKYQTYQSDARYQDEFDFYEKEQENYEKNGKYDDYDKYDKYSDRYSEVPWAEPKSAYSDTKLPYNQKNSYEPKSPYGEKKSPFAEPKSPYGESKVPFKESNKNSYQQNDYKPYVESATVQYCEQGADKKWVFTVHVKYSDDSLNILKRNYDDFWALQVTLISRFPVEAGRGGEPRSIPFLAPPQGQMTPQQAQQCRFDLHRYLSELVIIPEHVLDSEHVSKFFLVRPGDLNSSAIDPIDVADTLMDLLEDYQHDTSITIKLVLGQEIIAWKEPKGFTYDDLIIESENRLGFSFESLYYYDEVENMIPLYGDDDLALLLSLKKLKFYVK